MVSISAWLISLKTTFGKRAQICCRLRIELKRRPSGICSSSTSTRMVWYMDDSAKKEFTLKTKAAVMIREVPIPVKKKKKKKKKRMAI